MRVKIAMGLLALIAGCFLWFAIWFKGFNNELTLINKKNDNLDQSISQMEKIIFDQLSTLNPLARAYSQLSLGQDRERALAIIDAEFSIKDNPNSYSVSCGKTGVYIWQWQWHNKNDTGTIEDAILTITFNREIEGNCIMCKVVDATYTYQYRYSDTDKDFLKIVHNLT